MLIERWSNIYSMSSMSMSEVVFYFFFSCYGDHRGLHSFPTRRSSDLSNGTSRAHTPSSASSRVESSARLLPRPRRRSEEHTSELQSRRDLVCRLLLEKKNNKFHEHFNPFAHRH